MTNKERAENQVMAHMRSRGITIEMADVEALRRCEMVLQRWAEEECGNSDDYKSWSIERDEITGKPYRYTVMHSGSATGTRSPVADRETSTLKRVAKICARLGLHFYHQTDPRGVMLYVSKEKLTDQNYNSAGAACNA